MANGSINGSIITSLQKAAEKNTGTKNAEIIEQQEQPAKKWRKNDDGKMPVIIEVL